MKKVIFLLICLSFVSCGQKTKTKKVYIDRNSELWENYNEEELPQYLPLTPGKVKKTLEIAKKLLQEEGLNIDEKYTQLYDVCDQHDSSLCAAFALRDLMLNNLGLDEENKPAVFSLLTLNPDFFGQLLIHNDLSFDSIKFAFFKLASYGGNLLTEESLPFDAELLNARTNILKGHGFEDDNYSIPNIKPKKVPLNQVDDYNEDNSPVIVLNPETILKDKNLKYVKIPKFRVLQHVIHSENISEEIVVILKNLMRGKYQYVSVCSEYIYGLSSVLTEDENDSRNTKYGGDTCGFHAILLTSTYLNENEQVRVVFRNSWGNLYTDNGFIDVSLEEFLYILRRKSDDRSDSRILSKRIELELFLDSDELPIHELQANVTWVSFFQTQDGVRPVGSIRWTKNVEGEEYMECDVREQELVNCHGRIILRSDDVRSRFFIYEGELKASLSEGFLYPGSIENGKGREMLFGKIVAEGTYVDGILREGVKNWYFSSDRSSLVFSRAQGTFDEEGNLVCGKDIFYNRAGEVVDEEVVSLTEDCPAS